MVSAFVQGVAHIVLLASSLLTPWVVSPSETTIWSYSVYFSPSLCCNSCDNHFDQECVWRAIKSTLEIHLTAAWVKGYLKILLTAATLNLQWISRNLLMLRSCTKILNFISSWTVQLVTFESPSILVHMKLLTVRKLHWQAGSFINEATPANCKTRFNKAPWQKHQGLWFLIIAKKTWSKVRFSIIFIYQDTSWQLEECTKSLTSIQGHLSKPSLPVFKEETHPPLHTLKVKPFKAFWESSKIPSDQRVTFQPHSELRVFCCPWRRDLIPSRTVADIKTVTAGSSWFCLMFLRVPPLFYFFLP